MRSILCVLALIAVSLPAMAGISSSSIVTVATVSPRAVAVVVSMPADFVSVPLRIISDQKNAAQAYEESERAIELICKKAAEGSRFETTKGVVALSQHRSSFGISSGSWSQPAAEAELYLLVPFAKGQDSIFTAGAEAARFVDGLNLPGKVRCELGKLQLAVKDPEQYRARLLKEIALEAKKTREAISANGRIKVEGLESSVLVRQSDDRNVELFLDYSLSLEANE